MVIVAGALLVFLVHHGYFIGAAPTAATAELPLETNRLPPGFHIEVYASGVDNARSLALGETASCSSARVPQETYTRSSTATTTAWRRRSIRSPRG